jgi:hypothetical protein
MNTAKQSRMAFRLGGGIVILATVIMVCGAAIPFFAPSLREAPWTDDPAQAEVTIAGNPTAYAWAQGLFLAAAILTALGFTPLSLGFQGRSRLWSMMALVAFSFGAVFSVIDRTIDISVYTWGALQGLEVTDLWIQSLMHFQTGLSFAFYVLAFLALSLYGIAILQQPGIRALGWVFVIGGVLGIVLRVFGDLIPAFIFFGSGALGAAAWLLGVDSETET